MSTKVETRVFHVLRDGLSLPQLPAHAPRYPDSMSAVLALSDRAARRGDEIEVSVDYIEATRNRFGDSWASDLSEEAQLERWGEIRFGSGPTPEWILAELADEAATAAESLRLESLHQARRYGTRRAE